MIFNNNAWSSSFLARRATTHSCFLNYVCYNIVFSRAGRKRIATHRLCGDSNAERVLETCRGQRRRVGGSARNAVGVRGLLGARSRCTRRGCPHTHTRLEPASSLTRTDTHTPRNRTPQPRTQRGATYKVRIYVEKTQQLSPGRERAQLINVTAVEGYSPTTTT